MEIMPEIRQLFGFMASFSFAEGLLVCILGVG